MRRGNQSSGRSLGYRGAEGRKRAEEERKRSDARRKAGGSNQPFRFFMRPGETKELILLDEEPDFFMFEHNMKNPQTGKWGMTLPCLKDVENCPICENTDSTSYYAMFFTVIDLTEYTDTKGEKHEFSRKLLCVKSSQHKKFLRLYNKHKSLRGIVLEMTRDGDKDAAIGNDIEYVETIAEEELRKYVKTFKDREGNSKEEKCYEVYDYDAIFEVPDKAVLEDLVGAAPSPGSTRQVEEELGSDDDSEWEDADDDLPWDGETSAKATKAEEEEEEPEPEEEKPVRRRLGRRRPASQDA